MRLVILMLRYLQDKILKIFLEEFVIYSTSSTIIYMEYIKSKR